MDFKGHTSAKKKEKKLEKVRGETRGKKKRKRSDLEKKQKKITYTRNPNNCPLRSGRPIRPGKRPWGGYRRGQIASGRIGKLDQRRRKRISKGLSRHERGTRGEGKLGRSTLYCRRVLSGRPDEKKLRSSGGGEEEKQINFKGEGGV